MSIANSSQQAEGDERCLNVTRFFRPDDKPYTRRTVTRPRSARVILLFVSRQVGSRDGSPEPVFEKQVKRAFDKPGAVLKAAGCTFDDVVDVTTFHTDPAPQMHTVVRVRLEVIGDPLGDRASPPITLITRLRSSCT